ncbi:TetR family transcriptional regulator [Microbispora sp. ATCC PTA-5024]|nr:TetR/AcrR family transcriptional regulator [Microbispora sp. ATCC PTA-5024]ETK31602.1 TetR family transcriptional regulator [Microbispora sp. ATCC PTA-5024]
MISQRAAVVADAAIEILADRGMRGLTHRAVDEAAGLPPGSTSNLARTRAALLELTLDRLTEREEAALSDVMSAIALDAPAPDVAALASARPTGPDTGPVSAGRAAPDAGPVSARPGSADAGAFPLAGLAAVLARATYDAITVHRRATIARYELAMEATRRPELRTVYDEIGRRYRDPAVAMLAAAGAPDPGRQGRQIVAVTEGLIFDAVVGAGAVPTLDDLRAGFAEVLRAVLRSGEEPPASG